MTPAFDVEHMIDASKIAPQITWGTSPQDVIAVDQRIPDPSRETDPQRRQAMEAALAYMGLTPGEAIEGTPVDWVFVGSCTNGRLSDIREAARVVAGRKVAPNVRAWVVPGSEATQRAAEREGLDKIFLSAGFEWRKSGCSMCVGINGDIVAPGQRSVSTTNRNFVGPSGAECPDPSREPGHGRPPRRSPAASPTRASSGGSCRKFIRVTGTVAPLMKANIDTDVIIPANRLVGHQRDELGAFAFERLPLSADGADNPDFVLNQPRYRGAQHPDRRREFRLRLLARVGRLGARWYRLPLRHRAELWRHLRQQRFQNGMLLIRLPKEQVERLAAEVESAPRRR